MTPLEYKELLPFATQRQAEYIQAAIKHGSQRKAAAELGVNSRTLETALKSVKDRAAARGYSPDHDMHKTVPQGFKVKGVSTLYDQDGKPSSQWVKSVADTQKNAETKLNDFAEAFIEGYKGKIKPTKMPKIKWDENLMNCIVIGDAHLGLLAWGRETGVENYDTDISENDLVSSFDYLVDAAPSAEVGVILNLGDFFHSNSEVDLTPASKHILDTDSRFSYTIDAAARALRYAIDRMLKVHKEVWVVNQRGNHDPTAGLWLNKLIMVAYEKEPRVKVMNNEMKMINFSWGDNLICTHHGDRINRKRWYEALTRDFGSLWGTAKYRYGLQGHIHHENKEEIGGIVFESFQTMAAPDKWHADSGYGAGRSMTSITYHKNYGEVNRTKCSIDLIRRR